MYASDAFTRTASGGRGNADIGGAYAVAAPSSDYAVNGNTESITRDANGEVLRAVLAGISVRDVNAAVRVSADKVSTADQFAYLEFRRVDVNNTYQMRVRLATDGHAYGRKGGGMANPAFIERLTAEGQSRFFRGGCLAVVIG